MRKMNSSQLSEVSWRQGSVVNSEQVFYFQVYEAGGSGKFGKLAQL